MKSWQAIGIGAFFGGWLYIAAVIVAALLRLVMRPEFALMVAFAATLVSFSAFVFWDANRRPLSEHKT